jgi:hypothetical protein
MRAITLILTLITGFLTIANGQVQNASLTTLTMDPRVMQIALRLRF